MQVNTKLCSVRLLLFWMIFCVFNAKTNCAEHSMNRMQYVMYNGVYGIQAFERYVQFAHINNISQDLNIPAIVEQFSCKTQLGKSFLHHALERVISPQDTSGLLERRQRAIQILVQHPDLFNLIETLLSKAAEHEKVAAKFLSHRIAPQEVHNVVDFIQKWSALDPGVQIFFQAQSCMSLCNYIQTLPTDVQDTWKQLPTFMNFSKGILSGFASIGLIDYWLKDYAPPSIVKNTGLALLTTASLTTFMQSLQEQSLFTGKLNEVIVKSAGLFFVVQGLAGYYMKALELRNALHSMRELICIAEQIERLCDQYQIVLNFKISDITPDAGQNIINGLKLDRYADPKTYGVIAPFVQTFTLQVYESDIYLAPLYALLAEVDAYVACAAKFERSDEHEHIFCSSLAVQQAYPYIHTQGFWNALIPCHKVVENDITESRNIILTGANEGGKTTAIRAILQNIIFSQTFGIAAAREFIYTPFDIIYSFLHITDDILDGKSRFASELKQAQDILSIAYNKQIDEKFFFVIDELFTGTNGQDGAVVAHGFINKIASCQGTQFIYATHFEALKKIEQTNRACVNYKIEAPCDQNGQFIRDKEGNLVYSYKISPGVNNVNVALERARQAGVL